MNITLCTMTTREHTETARAIRLCLERFPHFSGIIVYTDKPEHFPVGYDIRPVSRFPEQPEPSMSAWGMRTLARGVAGDEGHLLHIHPDGYIVNASAWNPDWLNYDYIGAPWGNRIVGNNGFALISRRFWKEVARMNIPPEECFPADAVFCYPVEIPIPGGRGKHLKPALEAAGMKYAPFEVASRFSAEFFPWDGQFGFHGRGRGPGAQAVNSIPKELL